MAVAVVLTGVYTFQQYKSNVKNEMAKIEEESQKELEEYQSADAGDVINESTDDLTDEGLSGLPENGLNEETQDPASSGTGTSGDDTQSGQNDGLSTQDGTDTGTATENGTGSQDAGKWRNGFSGDSRRRK